MRLRRTPDGAPMLHETGQAVRVEDQAGNAGWAPLANLPADLSAAETSEVLALATGQLQIGNVLPPLGPEPQSRVAQSEDVETGAGAHSGATPLLSPEVPVPVVSPTPAPATERPPVISDEALQALAEAGVTLPPGSRVPAAPTAAERLEVARAEKAEADARTAKAKAAEAEQRAAGSRPVGVTPSAIVDSPTAPGAMTCTLSLSEQARLVATQRAIAEDRAATTEASLRMAAMLNAHVAQTREANQQAAAAQAHQARQAQGVAPAQLWGLGCLGYLLGGPLCWGLCAALGGDGGQLVGAATFGQIALPLLLIWHRRRQVQDVAEAQARQQRKEQFLAHQSTKEVSRGTTS